MGGALALVAVVVLVLPALFLAAGALAIAALGVALSGPSSPSARPESPGWRRSAREN